MSDKALQSIQDTLRIPFYQYQSESRNELNIDSTFDQGVMNMIPEKIQDFDTQTIKQQLTKRPGILGTGIDWSSLLGTSSDDFIVRDFICITAVYDVFVAAIFDLVTNAFYIIQVRPITGTFVKLGGLTPASLNDEIYLTEISQTNGSGSLLPGVAVHWVKNNLTTSAGYYALTSAGVFTSSSLTLITSTAFPPNQTPALISVGRIINQRGTFYVATLNGQIFNSYAGQNDITAWANATSQIGSINTDMYPDQCLGLERHKGNIVAFSRNTIEFFADVGTSVNNPSTLQTMDQAFIKFGALKQNLIMNIDDVLYWIAYGENGQTGLWALDGYTPVKLSDAYVDSLITTTATNLNTYDFRFSTCTMHGKRQLFIGNVGRIFFPPSLGTFDPTDTYQVTIDDGTPGTIVFNIEDRTWWFWQTEIIGSSGVPLFATSFASPSQGALYSQYLMFSDGNSPSIWKISSLYEDNLDGGSDSIVPITALVQVNPLWFGNEKRKRISKFKIITNTTPARQSSAGVVTDTSSYNMYLLYIRDSLVDYDVRTPNIITRKLSNPPANGRYYWNNLGMGRVWNFAILDKSRMPLRLDSFEVDIQQGSH